MFKQCTKCKETKEITKFHKQKKGKYGVKAQCKVCKNEFQKQYQQDNKEDLNEYQKKLRKNNALHKLSGNTSCMINMSFVRTGILKPSKLITVDIIGCSIPNFMVHLYQTFIDRYNRLPTINDNLHIDHIIPITCAPDEAAIYELNHYSNLQWLIAEDNREKSDTL